MTDEKRQRILCSLTDDQGNYYYDGPLDGVWGPKSQEAAKPRRRKRAASGSGWNSSPPMRSAASAAGNTAAASPMKCSPC